MRKIKNLIIVLTIFLCLALLTGMTYSTRQEVKNTAHQIAELARSLNLPEDDPIIKRAQELWWEAHELTEEEPIPPDEPEITLSPELETAAVMAAKVIYGESRGIYSITEQACIVWTICNRVDAGYGDIASVITQPYQFAYNKNYPTVDDYGRDLVELSRDVLMRWQREKNGESEVGRVLPQGYLWYSGNGRHNYFRNNYYNLRDVWDYSLPSPYAN